MKVRMMNTAVLCAALGLAASAVSFAAQPAKVGIVLRSEAPLPSEVTRAVRSGKGTPAFRYQETLSGSAFRSLTAEERGTVKPAAPHGLAGDTAFRK